MGIIEDLFNIRKERNPFLRDLLHLSKTMVNSTKANREIKKGTRDLENAMNVEVTIIREIEQN